MRNFAEDFDVAIDYWEDGMDLRGERGNLEDFYFFFYTYCIKKILEWVIHKAITVSIGKEDSDGNSLHKLSFTVPSLPELSHPFEKKCYQIDRKDRRATSG